MNINPDFRPPIFTPEREPIKGTPVVPEGEATPDPTHEQESNRKEGEQYKPKLKWPLHGPDKKDKGIGINHDSFS